MYAGCWNNISCILVTNTRLNVKVVALSPSGLFLARILPPCASIIFFEINKPKPVPCSDEVVNFEKGLGNFGIYPRTSILYCHNNLLDV